MCWPLLLCLFRPFCIFERCLDLNPESCRSKQARYTNLATPSKSQPPISLDHQHTRPLFIPVVYVLCRSNLLFIFVYLISTGSGYGSALPIRIQIKHSQINAHQDPDPKTLVCATKSDTQSEAGVLVRKLSQPTPLSQAKRANPSYFTMLCGISCELAGCVHRPIVDSRVHDSRLRPKQTLVSFSLARSAKLSRLSSESVKLPPLVYTRKNDTQSECIHVVQCTKSALCSVQFFKAKSSTSKGSKRALFE